MIRELANGRYRIERTLGRGGMASVYLARDDELRREVALKVLERGDGTMRARFLREARLAARLSHPNVVHVYDVGEEDGVPYIVMEYVPGHTLAQAGRVRAEDAVPLALQACAGLQHAHEAGLVHRDVKPANLLVREDGVLKIADFGIARTADATHLTQHGTILGTAAYLAPEQAAGEQVTTAADIYSLGAVLYEVLTGRPPYEFDSIAELVGRQAAGIIVAVRDLAPAVPEPVEAAVMHALAREPEFRPPSAAAFADELARASEVRTEPLLATAVTETLGSRAQRNTGAWLLIAGAAVLGAVAIVLGVAQTGDDERAPAPPRAVQVPPPPRGATPAADARNLSAWLRANARANP